MAKLGDLCEFENGDRGKNYPSKGSFKAEGIPFINAGNLSNRNVDQASLNFISEQKFHKLSNGKIRDGDILFCLRGSIGKFAVVRNIEFGAIASSLVIIRPKTTLNLNYLANYLRSTLCDREIKSYENGAAQPNLSAGDLKKFDIPLPPLPEQKKIATILDAADALRQKDQQLIKHYTSLSQSLFLEMFGDPVGNPMGWELNSLKNSSLKFSDGPFGSNLKSEHYAETGIRVLRLQNIGVNQLVDVSKAYVSIEHYSTISKHTCLSGDIIIATMGEPNIRACILPKYISKAINKADCVQFRVDPQFGNAQYFNHLLNTPSFLTLVSHLLHGQTRTRISMGKLREVKVPIPPIKVQKIFAQHIEAIEQQKQQAQASLEKSETLFNSLLQRAFKGELTQPKTA